MGLRQEQAIAAAIAPIFADDNGGGLCCTLDTVNLDGVDVSIQVMQDSINIAPYPYREEPLTRMALAGVLTELDDPVLEVVDWDANAFATVGTSSLDAREVAELVDLTFVKLLSCDDASYTISATTEDLG
jgi:hypothetical protein